MSELSGCGEDCRCLCVELLCVHMQTECKGSECNEHRENECGFVLLKCPLGCGEPHARNEMADHIDNQCHNTEVCGLFFPCCVDLIPTFVLDSQQLQPLRFRIAVVPFCARM